MSEEVLRRRLARSAAKVRVLEDMIENKTRELYLANQEIVAALEYQRRIASLLPESLVVVDEQGQIRQANESAVARLGEIVGQSIDGVWSLDELSAQPTAKETAWRATSGDEIPMLVSVASLRVGERQEYVCVATDLRERRAMEVKLRHAQKLQSVGQLAAGIAHEINTPMQFIGDNLEFLSEAFDDTLALTDALVAVASMTPELEAKMEDADLDFVRKRVPRSVQKALDGVKRVAEIVAAMKAFSRPQADESRVDINECIRATLAVATYEYREHADMHVDLDEELPMVGAQSSDLHQVVLHLVVNAVHAIQDSGKRGEIRVRSSVEDGDVVIAVADTGTGIPEDVRPRIFEPFFTTKPVGRGSGQGLSFVYAVMESHGGTIRVESEVGQGTTFTLRLPVQASKEAA